MRKTLRFRWRRVVPAAIPAADRELRSITDPIVGSVVRPVVRPIVGAIVTSISLMAGLTLSACGERPAIDEAPASQPGTAPGDPHPAGIDWIEGDMERAFALAREEDKPVFLYWGADWCPYCNQIKATVFSRRAFIDRSRLFVPVYLDGDLKQAQKIGERYGVVGYPTVIVLRPDGTEVSRLASGVDIELYARVLDAALAQGRPVSELARAVVEGDARLSDSDYRLLAYYAWDQDNDRILGDIDPVTLFATLSESCPPDLEAECSRLELSRIGARIEQAGSEENPVPLTAAERADGVAALEEVLADPALVAANMRTILREGAAFVGALTEPGSERRERLAARWRTVLERLAADETVSMRERLLAAYAPVELRRIDDPEAEPSASTRAAVLALVEHADAQVSDPFERQTVVHAAWNVLTDLGEDERAEALLLAEVERSDHGYYFMTGLSRAAAERGNTEEALAWLERAYREAEGPATRFQWGYNYISGLLMLAPDDLDRIESVTREVFAELEPIAETAFYQRTKNRLGRLDGDFDEWNTTPERNAVAKKLRRHVLALCARIPDEDPSRTTCERFLAPSTESEGRERTT